MSWSRSSTSVSASGGRPGTRVRVVSWLWDYLLVLGWLLAVLVVMGGGTWVGVVDLTWLGDGAWAYDLFILALTVVPFVAYLTWTEASPAHATFGKRRAHLQVQDASGHPPRPSRVLLRNVVKALPWQFGHMAASRFATGGDTTEGVIWYVLSMVTLAVVAGPALLGTVGVHDLVAGTRVAARAGQGVAGTRSGGAVQR